MKFSIEISRVKPRLRIKRDRTVEPPKPTYISETKPVQPWKSVDRALELEDTPRKIPVEVIEGSAIVEVVVKHKH